MGTAFRPACKPFRNEGRPILFANDSTGPGHRRIENGGDGLRGPCGRAKAAAARAARARTRLGFGTGSMVPGNRLTHYQKRPEGRSEAAPCVPWAHWGGENLNQRGPSNPIRRGPPAGRKRKNPLSFVPMQKMGRQRAAEAVLGGTASPARGKLGKKKKTPTCKHCGKRQTYDRAREMAFAHPEGWRGGLKIRDNSGFCRYTDNTRPGQAARLKRKTPKTLAPNQVSLAKGKLDLRRLSGPGLAQRTIAGPDEQPAPKKGHWAGGNPRRKPMPTKNR